MEPDRADKTPDRAIEDEIRAAAERAIDQARIRTRGYITKYATVMDRLG